MRRIKIPMELLPRRKLFREIEVDEWVILLLAHSEGPTTCVNVSQLANMCRQACQVRFNRLLEKGYLKIGEQRRNKYETTVTKEDVGAIISEDDMERMREGSETTVEMGIQMILHLSYKKFDATEMGKLIGKGSIWTRVLLRKLACKGYIQWEQVNIPRGRGFKIVYFLETP